MKATKGPLLALTSALMAATSASSASAWENPLESPYLEEPLDVCDQGSFFVGGVPKVTKYAAGPTAGDPQQITILDLNKRVCPQGTFTWSIGNLQIRSDGLHFTEEGVQQWIAPWLLPQLADMAYGLPPQAPAGMQPSGPGTPPPPTPTPTPTRASR